MYTCKPKIQSHIVENSIYKFLNNVLKTRYYTAHLK